MCALIKNCLNAEEAQRKKIAQDGVAQPLVELIKVPSIEGLRIQEEVVAKAASAIWNLCGSEDGKLAVVQAVSLKASPISTQSDPCRMGIQRSCLCFKTPTVTTYLLKSVVGPS